MNNILSTIGVIGSGHRSCFGWSVWSACSGRSGRWPRSLPTRSLYRSRAGSHFYGTEYEIWADFGPVGNTEKKSFGPIMSNFWGGFFMFSLAKQMLKFFEKHCSFHTKMLRNIFFIDFYFFLNFFGKNWLNIHNQFCIALLQATDTFMRNFYKMTLLSKTLLK